MAGNEQHVDVAVIGLGPGIEVLFMLTLAVSDWLLSMWRSDLCPATFHRRVFDALTALA